MLASKLIKGVFTNTHYKDKRTEPPTHYTYKSCSTDVKQMVENLFSLARSMKFTTKSNEMDTSAVLHGPNYTVARSCIIIIIIIKTLAAFTDFKTTFSIGL